MAEKEMVGASREPREEGRETVVAPLHQPSSLVFTSVLLLSEGRRIFFGDSAYSITYFSSVDNSPSSHVNPADFSSISPMVWRVQFSLSPRNNRVALSIECSKNFIVTFTNFHLLVILSSVVQLMCDAITFASARTLSISLLHFTPGTRPLCSSKFSLLHFLTQPNHRKLQISDLLEKFTMS